MTNISEPWIDCSMLQLL